MHRPRPRAIPLYLLLLQEPSPGCLRLLDRRVILLSELSEQALLQMPMCHSEAFRSPPRSLLSKSSVHQLCFDTARDLSVSQISSYIHLGSALYLFFDHVSCHGFLITLQVLLRGFHWLPYTPESHIAASRILVRGLACADIRPMGGLTFSWVRYRCIKAQP